VGQSDWPRWIYASVADYFKEIATDESLSVVVEGLDERTKTFMDSSDRAEVRITGPLIQGYSKGYYRALVDVSILLTSRYDGAAKNSYGLYKYAGIFSEAMDDDVEVWNFGNEAGDYTATPATQVKLGCLKLLKGVTVAHFGQTDVTAKVKQCEVNCRYEMEIQE
jgi:hypothetical protein